MSIETKKKITTGSGPSPSKILGELLKMQVLAKKAKEDMSPSWVKDVRKKLGENFGEYALEASSILGPKVVEDKLSTYSPNPIEVLSSAIQGKGGSQEQAQSQGKPEGMDFLSKLLISVGSGMATAGGHGEIVDSLLDMVSEKEKMEQRQISGEDEALEQGRLLNNMLMQAQIDSLKQFGNISEAQKLENIPEQERDDYVIKPVQQKIRGVVTTVPVIERKKTLSASKLEELGGLENSRRDLESVIDRLKKSGLQLGPGFSTPPGVISDMLGQMKGKEFASIKSDIGRNFQLYRKWATGVAAGYPELNMLAPNYPKATDINEVFIQKTLDVMKDIERQKEILLDYYSKGGYAVSQLRNESVKSKEIAPGYSSDEWEVVQ